MLLLLGVKEENKFTSDGWVLFISTSRFKYLTCAEIGVAYRMALARELRSEKYEVIEVYRDLSTVTAGLILDAYMRYKDESYLYQNAKNKLKRLNIPKKSEEQIKREEENTFIKYSELIFQELKENKFTFKATFHYNKIIKKKFKINKNTARRLYQFQLYLYLNKIRSIKDLKETKEFDFKLFKSTDSLDQIKENIKNNIPIVAVQQRCRDIIVSNYLRRFTTIEELRSELKDLTDDKY